MALFLPFLKLYTLGNPTALKLPSSHRRNTFDNLTNTPIGRYKLQILDPLSIIVYQIQTSN